MTDQFKPKLRKEAELDVKSALEQATWNVLARQAIFPYQNCLSCCHFTEKTEQCLLFNSRPPARVICFGCPKYEDKEQIPF